MFCKLRQKIIYPVHVSKNNSKNFGKHIILLMILNGGGSNHITIKITCIINRNNVKTS